MHIFPNISRSKDNQTMKLEQLTECNLRNIILEKSYTKHGGQTSPRPFSGKLKLSIISGPFRLKFYTVFFCCILSWGLVHWNWDADHLRLPHIKHIFLKKRGLELVSLPYI